MSLSKFAKKLLKLEAAWLTQKLAKVRAACRFEHKALAVDIWVVYKEPFQEPDSEGNKRYHLMMVAHFTHEKTGATYMVTWEAIADRLREVGYPSNLTGLVCYAYGVRYGSVPTRKKMVEMLDPEPLFSPGHPDIMDAIVVPKQVAAAETKRQQARERAMARGSNDGQSKPKATKRSQDGKDKSCDDAKWQR